MNRSGTLRSEIQNFVYVEATAATEQAVTAADRVSIGVRRRDFLRACFTHPAILFCASFLIIVALFSNISCEIGDY